MSTPPSPPPVPSDAALGRALALVRDLRARCPWDHGQTRETLRPYLVEEALELDQALRHGDPVALRDELGDLLLHLAFQIVIGEERREFDADAVTRGLEEKMWRRHPHLFGDSPTPDHEGWERAKKSRLNKRDVALVGNLLTRVFPIHHLLAWHSGRDKNSLLMQFPNNLDLYLRNSAWSGLGWIDQTKRSICADVATEQPAFIQLFHHFSFGPSFHSLRQIAV